MTMGWLPAAPEDFRARLKALRGLEPSEAIREIRALAGHDLGFVQVNALDQVVQALAAHLGDTAFSAAAPGPVIRLALLGSSTTVQLHAGIRIAGWRHGVRIVTFEGEYGQYRQDILQDDSALARFRPDVALFCLDARHLTAGASAERDAEAANAALDRTLSGLAELWQRARERLGAIVLQQTVLPVFPDLLGNNEHRIAWSPSCLVDRLNARLRDEADRRGVHLLALDRHVRQDGIRAWHDPALWCRSKQEVTLSAAPLYGDLVARLLSALGGRSAKALVLDLDNTLWGGVIGDDGLEGIVLGEGSAAGEGFASLQRHALSLSERGIILAVCSKNDEAVAAQPFAEHPEMVLKRAHIASFVANWEPKADNIRRIASELNIGLDAIVFVDDNPFERNQVRSELPMVRVPEVPEDPALIPFLLADAGYFESVALTADDLERTHQYQANRARQSFAGETTDMDGYLRSLDMRLLWRRFGPVDLPRVVQLVNKTNQYNLTTRRTSDAEMRAVMDDPKAFGVTLRLVDRFGDNGIIAVVTGHLEDDAVHLDDWLMSCRVLGRKVEMATLNVVLSQASALGAARLAGTFLPTAKNGMVRDHYDRLGFTLDRETASGERFYTLPVAGTAAQDTAITIEELT